jgi:hypothetical protein
MPMPRRPQKRTAERPGQQPQSLIAIDPLVGPGNPPHRHPPCPKTDQSRQHHCMVSLATCASSPRSESAHQTKYATVMLAPKLGHDRSMPTILRKSVGACSQPARVEHGRPVSAVGAVLFRLLMVAADNVASPSWPRSLRRHGFSVGIGWASQANSVAADPSILAYGGVVEIGRGGSQRVTFSQAAFRETCWRRASLSREALHSRETQMSGKLFP